MNVASEKRLLAIWLALSAITVVSWWIGSPHGHDAFKLNAAITYAVIVIATIKARVIIAEFMEVRHAPVLLRRLTDGWLLFIAVALLGTYSVGMLFSRS